MAENPAPQDDEALELGKLWKTALQDHPLAIVASLVALGFGTGFTFRAVIPAPRASPATVSTTTTPKPLPAATKAAEAPTSTIPTTTTLLPFEDGSVDCRQIANRISEINPRFAEYQAYLPTIVGTKVHCPGSVFSVHPVETTTGASGHRIQMDIDVEGTPDTIFCDLDSAQKERAMALRRGEPIQVSGEVGGTLGWLAIYIINCSEFALLEP